MYMRRCGLTLVLALMMTVLLLPAAGAEAGAVVELPVDFSFGLPLQEKWEQGKKVYDDPSIHVEHYSARSDELICTYYVVDIKIASASQMRAESAAGGPEGFKSRQRVSVPQMARRVNAVVALDGDYYGEHPGSLVVRQGVVFRGVQETYHDLLLIDEDGDFHVILAGNRDTEEGYGNTFPSTPVTEEQLTRTEDGKKIINGFDFGPCIILNGEAVEANPRSIVHPHKTQSWNRAQRICLCQLGPLEYRIVAVAHFGLSVQDMTKLVLSLGGVQTAYMFDGGDSAQIAFLGRRINNVNGQQDRPVCDCIYFASAYQP
ncbi:MAG: phosphodiester glycosidase family protein [Clostridiales bacterium]|nr:phosphodiester glycosidase family protein [Clostridiales bacterium]